MRNSGNSRTERHNSYTQNNINRKRKLADFNQEHGSATKAQKEPVSGDQLANQPKRRKITEVEDAEYYRDPNMEMPDSNTAVK